MRTGVYHVLINSQRRGDLQAAKLGRSRWEGEKVQASRKTREACKVAYICQVKKRLER